MLPGKATCLDEAHSWYCTYCIVRCKPFEVTVDRADFDPRL
jgi:hypothetical protein